MAIILFAWEFGGGLGHVARMQPLVASLAEDGHRVVVAARNVPLAAKFLAPLPVSVIQAPLVGFPSEQIKIPYSFAHVLFNCSFADDEPLLATALAWRALFDLIRPDLLVADYSPVALLAARGTPIKVVAIGTGFECPPDVAPLPSVRSGPTPSVENLLQIEEEMLVAMNAVADKLQAPRFSRVAQLYHHDTLTLLLTYPELDLYARASDALYCGVHAYSPGIIPVWPGSDSSRVFVYLKSSDRQEELLAALASLELNALVYAGRSSQRLQQRFGNQRMRFESKLLSHDAIVRDCDVAVTNGGHLLVATLLLAGKPTVIVPQSLEQQLNAERVKSLGGGEWVLEANAASLPTAVSRVLGDNSYAIAAEQFASKHRMLQGELSQQRTRQHIEQMLSR